MREMKESGIPFVEGLPKNWKEIPNRFLFECHSKKVGEQFSDYQLLSLTTAGVKQKDINASGGKVPDSYNNYQTVEKGDMIFCLFDLDCSAVFSGRSDFDGMITSAYDVFRTNTEYLDNHFSDYWFQYVFTNRYYKMYSKNIRYTVTGDGFKAIKTPIPSIEEQKKIGSKLDAACAKVDSLIANQEAQIEKLKAYKQSLITEVVTKGLDKSVPMKDSGVDRIGYIPQGWEMVALQYLTYIRARLGWKGLKADEYVDDGYTFIGTPNIDENGNIDWNNVFYITKERYEESPEIMLNSGDVLLTKDGAGIGKCAFIDSLPKEATPNGSLAVITPNENLRGKYLFFYFKSYYFQKYIDQIKGGMGVPHLFQSDLRKIQIPVPSVNEQERIITYLDEKCAFIDQLISIKQQKIEKLNQYKKSLIYEYVTGKKEV